jgi:hypothetical protein
VNESLVQKNIKILIFCFVVINLQVSLLSGFAALPFNLAFVSILVIASLLGIYESMLAASILCIGASLLIYDHYIFWLYPLIALIANRINPPQIADKFLICIIYNLGFTPLIELLHPSTNYTNQILTSILTNLLCAIPLFFVVKFFFSNNSRNLYVRIR